MKSQFFRFAEDRILVEQLRLLYGNVGSSVIPAILVALLLVITLANDSNRFGLWLWCSTVIVSKLYSAIHARQQLAADIARDKLHRQVGWLVFIHAVDGAAWGTLAWVTLSSTSTTGSILVVSVLAGVLGNSMALLSPVLPAFTAFTLTLVLLLASKLWVMQAQAYEALGVASILYLASLLGQARNSEAAARSAIQLRFDNVSLMKLANEARQEAEEANQAKSKFLAAASHDLRQPIHAQGLFLDVLGRTPLTPEQGAILASTRSAWLASGEMLNALLDFSRIEAGVVKPFVHPFELQSLLHKIENDLAPQADAKGLVFRLRDTALRVNSDATLVELILRNLVSNAIRYTERGGVLIGCRRRAGQVVVEVWDSGIGIDAAQHQSIFREFHQLGNPERDRHKGLGLGLAIADGLARTLGLALSLASRPGRGSVFRLTLPLTSAAVVQDTFASTHDAWYLRGMHMLVIDDDATIRAGMAQLLHSWGCTFDTAESITQALSLARRQVPDVVISDYRLREQRTGTQAIAALRALLGESLPAVLITGDTAPERLRDALASGVPLLHKPVSPEQLFQRLAEVLGRRSKESAPGQLEMQAFKP
jgi:signal transduction histidine kinase/ActR/RegA family two-component response regulator